MDFILKTHPLKDKDLDIIFSHLSLVLSDLYKSEQPYESYVDSFHLNEIYEKQIINHSRNMKVEQIENCLSTIKNHQLEKYFIIDLILFGFSENNHHSKQKEISRWGEKLTIATSFIDRTVQMMRLIQEKKVENLISEVQHLSKADKKLYVEYMQEPDFLVAIGRYFLKKKYYKEAYYWFHKGSEYEDADALYELGELIHFGDGVKKDREKAMEIYRRSAVQGHKDAENRLGFTYSKLKDYDKANYWYELAVKHGSAEAHINLSYAYLDGLGLEVNKKKAFQHMLQAAKMGIVHAQNTVGIFYYKGIGVKDNEEEALKWSLKAAKKGNMEAQYGAGIIYNDKKDYEKAKLWLEKAAKQGHRGAAEELRLVDIQLEAKEFFAGLMDEWNNR